MNLMNSLGTGITIIVAVLIILALLCTVGFSAGMMGMVSNLVSGFAK